MDDRKVTPWVQWDHFEGGTPMRTRRVWGSTVEESERFNFDTLSWVPYYGDVPNEVKQDLLAWPHYAYR